MATIVSKRSGQVNTRRGFPYPAFLVGDGNNPSHKKSCLVETNTTFYFKLKRKPNIPNGPQDANFSHRDCVQIATMLHEQKPQCVQLHMRIFANEDRCKMNARS